MTEGRAPRFGLLYDMRNPASAERSFEQLYAEVLEQVVRAEQLGYESIWLTEHHFSTDGYSPSPVPLAAAIAAKTSSVLIATNLMLAPLHHPLRLAEDAAMLSILSGGRFDLGLGIGYRELEFAGLGVNRRFRPSLIEDTVAILRRAWTGEPFSYEGKRFTIPELPLGPIAARAPRILIGGMSEPACRRAAAIGDGFLSAFNPTLPLYVEGLRDLGRDPADGTICALQWIVVADDPERAWAEVGRHALYQINMYVEWGGFGDVPPFESPAALLEAGLYQVWDGDAAVAALTDLVREYPQIEDIHYFAALPGESIASAGERIEYFARHVIPRVREGVLAGP
ncbi:MAG TPA: LLM class flavin-dependent oxidoreductase [Solirubrobacteraceae bacterium]|jgi:alkanesulfonate monooxygenase SsuD/methylene tetrahydromethanopterin reductase-like flavin-dependent oxidoreductase (luciferase family)|nr:LLM class flavin-dependent oxidoreductase [Solirubrobacteraceae bacterium]